MKKLILMACLCVMSAALVMAGEACADKGKACASEKGKDHSMKGEKIQLSDLPAAVKDAADHINKFWDPRMRATIITPINPHSFSQKPVVLPSEYDVEFEVLIKENKFSDVEVSLTLDGQMYFTLQRHDRIRAMMNKHTVKFLRRKKETFYATLRTKLKWGER